MSIAPLHRVSTLDIPDPCVPGLEEVYADDEVRAWELATRDLRVVARRSTFDATECDYLVEVRTGRSPFGRDDRDDLQHPRDPDEAAEAIRSMVESHRP